MSSYDKCVRIERLANGYNITVKDPAIVAANNARDNSIGGKGPYKPYRDPERCYTFKGISEVNAWLTANLDKALPKDDPIDSFEATFDKASKAVEKMEKY